MPPMLTTNGFSQVKVICLKRRKQKMSLPQ